MPNGSLKIILPLVLSAIIVDVFCGDITNSRQTNAWQNSQSGGQKYPDISANTKSSTPWPALGQRYSPASPTPVINPTRPSTASPKKWIQANNLWIRNEQASSGAINGHQVAVHGTSITQAPQQSKIGPISSTSAKPPLKRGDTYTVIKPSIIPINTNNNNNNKQGPIDGSVGNKAGSSSTTSTPKPLLSYANALGPKSPNIQTPTSPIAPVPPQKKDSIPSAGPGQDKIQDFDEPSEDASVSYSGDSTVTDDELREFSETLLRKDSNNAMKHVSVNLQGMTTSRSTNDQAPLPLLKVNSAAYKIPSIEKMILLYNNYIVESNQNEIYTGQEKIEENNLLDAILATPVIQFARSFLVQKGKIGKDPKEFKDLLRQIWFNMYSRGQGRIGSSGFEHVFLAEIKNNQVSGLHNWVYFNEEESQQRANYLGYLKKLDLGEKGAILKYHFTFRGIDKPVGSMFIGTSPELEIALYSTCFLLRADRICPLKMNGNRFIIRTFTYRYRGKNMIGSAFPEI